MSASGSELRNNNEKIVKLMSLLKQQRDEMHFLIEKQQDEKTRIENEIEKLSFKLTLLTKSLNQRVQAKSNYDKTIKEIDDNYSSLVEVSEKLLYSINKEVSHLEEIMDKKIGTGETGEKPKSVPQSPNGPKSQSFEEIKSNDSKNRKNSIMSDAEHPKETKDPVTFEDNDPPTSDQVEEISPSASVEENINQPPTEEPEVRSLHSQRHSASSNESNTRKSASISSRRSSQRSTSRKSSASQNAFPSPDSSISKKSATDYYNPPKIKRGDDSDAELQSYREAYEKQHTA